MYPLQASVALLPKTPAKNMLHKNLETNLSANQRRRKLKDCNNAYFMRNQTRLKPVCAHHD